MSKNKRASVAIVSSMQMVNEVLKNVLQENGFDVSISCAEGKTFFAEMKESNPPDICLINCEARRTESFIITKMIKANWPTMKVALFGLPDDMRVIKKARSFGADEVLTMGANLTELNEALGRLVFCS